MHVKHAGQSTVKIPLLTPAFYLPVDPVHGNVGAVRRDSGAERVGYRRSPVHQCPEESHELLYYAARYRW